jgi:hypothetical protein
MSKIMIALAAGAGYVLGARAGRARYEQITQKATELWNNPRVQEGTAQAQDLLKDAPNVPGKIADVASAASAKARPGSHQDDASAATDEPTVDVTPGTRSSSRG